jgi:DNA-binding response OmpR family regulator
MRDRVPGLVLVVAERRTADERALEERLCTAGFGVRSAHGEGDLVEALGPPRPDVVVFTPSPGRRGHGARGVDADAIAAARRAGFTGAILVVGRKPDPSSVVAALERGADDYVALSCDPAELVARVRALARRAAGAAPLEPDVGGLALDLRRGVLRADDVEVPLTRREVDLLDYLARNAGRPVTRGELAAHIWHTTSAQGTNVVDVYVSYLRRKLGSVGRQSLIRSIRGVGYELVDTIPR